MTTGLAKHGLAEPRDAVLRPHAEQEHRAELDARIARRVDAIAAGPNNSVYIAGKFTTVNGATTRVDRLDANTGARVAGWTPPVLNGITQALTTTPSGALYIGGAFTTAKTGTKSTTHRGIVAVDHVPACILRLVVDLVAPGPCLPAPQEPEVAILGVALPRLRIDRAARDAGLAPGLVVATLRAATPGVSSQSHTPPRCGEAPAPRSAGAAGVA